MILICRFLLYVTSIWFIAMLFDKMEGIVENQILHNDGIGQNQNLPTFTNYQSKHSTKNTQAE